MICYNHLKQNISAVSREIFVTRLSNDRNNKNWPNEKILKGIQGKEEAFLIWLNKKDYDSLDAYESKKKRYSKKLDDTKMSLGKEHVLTYIAIKDLKNHLKIGRFLKD